MPLITTISELKQYIAIDGNTKMSTLTPFIKEAEQLYIVDLLGKQFYEAYLALYTASVSENPTPLEGLNLTFLPNVQRALAYYTSVQAIPHLSVSFGELGVRQQQSDSNDPAPRWKEEKLQFQALRYGDIHADKMLEYLESNATDINEFQLWLANAPTKTSGYIVYGVSVASRHIDINGSRRVFLKLKSKLHDIEAHLVPKWIGQDQYTALVMGLKANTLSTIEKELVAKIEPIICKRALFLQLPFMRVQITENGIFVYSGTDDLYLPGKLAGDVEIKTLRHQLKDGELGYLQDEEALQAFIQENIDSFPAIKASTAYTVERKPGPTWQPLDPDPEDKYFAI